MLPVIILWHTLFNLSLALLLSCSNVYFRDTQHFIGVLLPAWFFLSPAMYDLGLVENLKGIPEWGMQLYMLNPMAGIISLYRSALLPDTLLPSGDAMWVGLFWPLVLFGLSWYLFKKYQRNFADML